LIGQLYWRKFKCWNIRRYIEKQNFPSIKIIVGEDIENLGLIGNGALHYGKDVRSYFDEVFAELIWIRKRGTDWVARSRISRLFSGTTWRVKFIQQNHKL